MARAAPSGTRGVACGDEPRTRGALEQLSDSWSRQGVTGVGEPRNRIVGSDRLYCHPHGFPERLLGASAQSAQDGLELGKRLFDWRAVGGVGREEEQLAVACFDRLANAGRLVDA